MGLETDLLIDRRRLKRRLAFWRAGAVLLLLARRVLLWRARRSMRRWSAPAMSPGWTVRGLHQRRPQAGRGDRQAGQGQHHPRADRRHRQPRRQRRRRRGAACRAARLRADKPVVAVMRGTAASAGYMTAVAAERILARESTVTGSIGVLLQTFDASDLLGRVGVRAETSLRPAEGPAEPLPPALAGGPGGAAGRRRRHVRPVRRPRSRPGGTCRRSGCGPGRWPRPSPAGRRWRPGWWMPSAASRRRGPGWRPRSRCRGPAGRGPGRRGTARRLISRPGLFGAWRRLVLSEWLGVDGIAAWLWQLSPARRFPGRRR